jgi:hypothetical protein|tara:strand:+ start:797 stop:1072 length:276 start_codon:yes stop_codon:yes gene_type:complete
MLTDYKISSVVLRAGQLTVRVRFYEGAITTEDEPDPFTRRMVPVTRYRRQRLLRETAYDLPEMDDARLQVTLNGLLATDGDRDPITEQRDG